MKIEDFNRIMPEFTAEIVGAALTASKYFNTEISDGDILHVLRNEWWERNFRPKTQRQAKIQRKSRAIWSDYRRQNRKTAKEAI